MDKSSKNYEKLKHNISSHRLSIVHCFRADATKSFQQDAPVLSTIGTFTNNKSNYCCSNNHTIAGIRGPPYRQCTFDRILVDAPCSGLGQRPQMVWDMTVQQLESYPTYQRKILFQVHACIQQSYRLCM